MAWANIINLTAVLNGNSARIKDGIKDGAYSQLPDFQRPMIENDFDRKFLCVFSDGRSRRYRTKKKTGMRKEVSAV
jgi:hypothetical protein